MTVREIKEATCGVDENNKSKCVTVAGAHIYNLSDSEAEPIVLTEKTTLEPSANLIVHGNFCTIDLEFARETSQSLGDIFQCLEKYLSACDDNSEDKEAAAFISLIPYALDGHYYINAVNPIFWSLEPDMVGGQFRKIRIVFYADDVMFNEADEEINILDAIMTEKTESSDEVVYDDGEYDYTYDDNDEAAERNSQFSNEDNYLSYNEAEDDDDNEEEEYYS